MTPGVPDADGFPAHPENTTDLTPEAWRRGLRDRLREPWDPEDPDQGLNFLDRAVIISLAVAAASGHQLGQLSMHDNGPATVAGEELLAYLREFIQQEADLAYDRGRREGYAQGWNDGEHNTLEELR